MILTCDCKHEQQDVMYGRNKRVHNACGVPSDGSKARCTVCSTKRDVR